jgi:hypothetical protein
MIMPQEFSLIYYVGMDSHTNLKKASIEIITVHQWMLNPLAMRVSSWIPNVQSVLKNYDFLKEKV